MSLNIKKVWLKREEQEILVSVSDILPGDRVVVRMGNVIPFDGEVCAGEGIEYSGLRAPPIRNGIPTKRRMIPTSFLHAIRRNVLSVRK